MTNILLTVSYDGTEFCGWQRQDKANQGSPVRTVQGELEAAAKKMLKTPVIIVGSGRTDSGVHAYRQKANFFSPVDSVPPKKYERALNGLLPRDIRIIQSEAVPQTFSARYSATSRIYRYFIQTVEPPFADRSRYVWHIPNRPNVEVLNSMCSFLHGEIDCATFAAIGDQSKSTFRYIDNASFWYEDQLLVFEIEANAFLWKMVRSITGTLIRAEQKGLSPQDFKAILNSRDRSSSLFTAPPQGLFLYDVRFNGIRRHA